MVEFRRVGDRRIEETSKGLSQSEGKKKPEKFRSKPLFKKVVASGTNNSECITQGVKGFDFKNRTITKGAIKEAKGNFPLPTNVPSKGTT